MRNLVKLMALLSGIIVFSPVYSDDDIFSVDKVSSAIVESAKSSLLGKKGKFPFKTADGTEITNISYNSNNILFEFKIPSDSQTILAQYLTEDLRIRFNQEFCHNENLINVLNHYDIRFLFHFEYTDHRIVPAILSMNEICP